MGELKKVQTLVAVLTIILAGMFLGGSRIMKAQEVADFGPAAEAQGYKFREHAFHKTLKTDEKEKTEIIIGNREAAVWTTSSPSVCGDH